LVRPGSFYERPIPERHRIIFYVGHLEAFDWNLLRDRILDAKSFHEEFDRLFAFGIDPVGGGLPSDQPSDWPSLAEVANYVNRIRETVDAGLEEVLSEPKADREREFSAHLLLNVAVEHRLMHAETLAYMLHHLPLDNKVRASDGNPLRTSPVRPVMTEIPAGRGVLGLARTDETFGWDNEYEATVKEVPAFEIDRYKVTNGQYLEFMAAGGYENRALWNDAAWEWKTKHGIRHPVFWKRSGDRWHYRTMMYEIQLPLDWPVYVSQAEASAYAR
jgi:formylglycine-generating enzyme required for sulfatase activity